MTTAEFYLYLGSIIFVFGAWSIAVLLRGLRVPKKLRGTARCGACEYEVDDPKFGRCPECGNTYVTAGIMTGRSAARHRGGYLSVVFAWCMLSFVTAAVVLIGVIAIGDAVEREREDFGYLGEIDFLPVRDASVPESALAPSYRVTLRIEMVHNHNTAVNTPDGRYLSLVLGSIMLVLEVDGAEERFTVFEDVTQETVFELRDIHALFATAGLDAENPVLRHEADQLLLLLGHARDHPHRINRYISSSPSSRVVQDGTLFMTQVKRSGSDPLLGRARTYALSEDQKTAGGLILLNDGVQRGTRSVASILPWWRWAVRGVLVSLLVLWSGGLILCIRRRRKLTRLTPAVPNGLAAG